MQCPQECTIGGTDIDNNYDANTHDNDSDYQPDEEGDNDSTNSDDDSSDSDDDKVAGDRETKNTSQDNHGHTIKSLAQFSQVDENIKNAGVAEHIKITGVDNDNTDTDHHSNINEDMSSAADTDKDTNHDDLNQVKTNECTYQAPGIQMMLHNEPWCEYTVFNMDIGAHGPSNEDLEQNNNVSIH